MCPTEDPYHEMFISTGSSAVKGYSAQINATNLFDKTYVTFCQDNGCYYGLRRQVIATMRYRW